jgi:hypothetical protein
MATGLIDIMKRAAIDAEESSTPVDLKYGIVSQVEPELCVRITAVFILPSALLVVPESLTDHDVKIGEDTVTVYNGLKVGEKVALLRERGGGKYFILDRVAEGR